MKRILMTLTTVAALASAAGATAPVRPAPDVALTLDAGETIRLTDLKGQVVLVDFWASWCVPCRVSFPALDTLQRRYSDQGLKVIAVNVDEERRAAERFLENRPHTMAIAFDPRGNAARAFSLKGMPSTMMLDRWGNVRYTHMGYGEKSLELFADEIKTLLGES